MHPEISKALQYVKDSYSSLLNIVVDSSFRQNVILQKQVDLLKAHNEKLRVHLQKAKPVDINE